MVGEITRVRLARDSAVRANDPVAQFNAYASFYRDRGLSSDTSILTDYSVECALRTLTSQSALGAAPEYHLLTTALGTAQVDKFLPFSVLLLFFIKRKGRKKETKPIFHLDVCSDVGLTPCFYFCAAELQISLRAVRSCTT